MSFRAAGDHVAISLPGGEALFTTRAGGVSRGPYAQLNLGARTADDPAAVSENRARAAMLVGGRSPAWLLQVHGTRVAAGAAAAADEAADGVVTADRAAAPAALAADCLPIALIAPEAVGVVHAGWRGLHDGVIAAGIAALRALGATRVAGAIGPGIGACCYAVGDELRAAFGTTAPTLDLKAIAAGQLAAAGAAEVHDCGLCTSCDHRFFSHRRDAGLTGRQAGIAWRS